MREVLREEIGAERVLIITENVYLCFQMYKSSIDITMAVMDAEDDVSDSDEIDISPTTGDQQQDTEKVNRFKAVINFI